VGNGAGGGPVRGVLEQSRERVLLVGGERDRGGADPVKRRVDVVLARAEIALPRAGHRGQRSYSGSMKRILRFFRWLRASDTERAMDEQARDERAKAGYVRGRF
jgi:hypothetical protein